MYYHLLLIHSSVVSFLGLGSRRIIIGNAGVSSLRPRPQFLFLLTYLGLLSRRTWSLALYNTFGLLISSRVEPFAGLFVFPTLHYSYTTSSIHTIASWILREMPSRFAILRNLSPIIFVFPFSFAAVLGHLDPVVPTFIPVIVIFPYAHVPSVTLTRHSC